MPRAPPLPHSPPSPSPPFASPPSPPAAPPSPPGTVGTGSFRAGDATAVWVAGESNVTFVLTVTRDTWVALGVSPSGQMSSSTGNPAVVTRWGAGGDSTSDYFVMTANSNSGVRAADVPAGGPTFTLLGHSRADGTSTVTFSLPYTDSCGTHELAACRDVATDFLLAHGGNDDLGYHASRTSVGVAISPTSDGAVSYRSIRLFVLHGVLMWVAWLVLAPAGALLARFGKGIQAKLPGSKKPLWFAMHRLLMPLAALLTLVGFGVGVEMVTEAGATAHGKLGYFLFVLTMLQPLNAVVRPGHGARWRAQWEVLHKAQGHALWLLALLSSVLGANLLDERRVGAGDFASEGALGAAALAFALAWTTLFAALLARELLARRAECALKGKTKASVSDDPTPIEMMRSSSQIACTARQSDGHMGPVTDTQESLKWKASRLKRNMA